ncbi:DNA internalization-related competence protein ComEC/Rec2 [Betaproteobacteria bacterium]|nr:DNA internalization-related competence protein ComEC/Rec2 [Betaproteobacteria bacterium]GHU45103.1 DNA internalization-related competence protein ComEC/Rec2 [Betaproteobacteria bacterium]
MIHPTGIFLLTAALGVCALQGQAELPARNLVWLAGGLVVFAGAIRLFPRRFGLPLCLLVGLAGLAVGWGWAAWRAEIRLAEQLPAEWEVRDIRLTGTVASLPARFDRGERFEFQVDEILTPNAKIPTRLWLSFYTLGWRGEINPTPAPRAGERWEFTVRLKRPHGRANPHAFDYEAWLFERSLRATGYVRNAPVPVFKGVADWTNSSPMLAVHRLRENLRDHFLATLGGTGDAPYGGILTALAIGDQSAVPQPQWTIFNRTGTTHLMSISGLHVTLVAALAGGLLGWLWRQHPRLCLCLPAKRVAILGGVLAALVYGLISGLSIPAQRACLMLVAAATALLGNRRVGAGRILLVALICVLLFDPWAVLAAGFWLSFGAVAALYWVGMPHNALEIVEEEDPARLKNLRQRIVRYLRGFLHTQWAATTATLPLLFLFFQRFPLVSPFANLLAIPWVSFVITPLALLGALFAWLPLPILSFAHLLLAPLMAMLDFFAGMPLLTPVAPPLWSVLLAGVGVLLLLLPRGTPGKGAALVMLLPLLFGQAPELSQGQLRATALDVGQGQAVLLETANHRLLYDAAPGYGPAGEDGEAQTGRDAGAQVVLPYLTASGVRALDALVVSHRDNDHSGGMNSIVAGLPVQRVISSIPDVPGGETCRRGQSWTWDGVRFEFLHPPADKTLRGDNGDSCVLKVTSAGGRMLLTGDISAREERRLLAQDRAALAAEVILVPHHGSRTSSTLPFVAAVGADWALVSAGYRNRFNHPRPEIVDRYENLDTQLLRTDRDGALMLDFAEQGITVRRWRQEERRYWRD